VKEINLFLSSDYTGHGSGSACLGNGRQTSSEGGIRRMLVAPRAKLWESKGWRNGWPLLMPDLNSAGSYHDGAFGSLAGAESGWAS